VTADLSLRTTIEPSCLFHLMNELSQTPWAENLLNKDKGAFAVLFLANVFSFAAFCAQGDGYPHPWSGLGYPAHALRLFDPMRKYRKWF
jgi:hypothetical protein